MAYGNSVVTSIFNKDTFKKKTRHEIITIYIKILIIAYNKMIFFPQLFKVVYSFIFEWVKSY